MDQAPEMVPTISPVLDLCSGLDRPRGWVPSLPLVLGEPVDTPARAQLRRVWLPVEETSAHTARLLVTACCADWSLPGLLETARIGVSELVTNGLRHVDWQWVTPPRLIAVDVIRQNDSGLMIEVFDPDPRLPSVSSAPEVTPLSMPEHGFGLRTLAMLAADHGGFIGWRHLRFGDRLAGKGVWLRLRIGHAAMPAP